MKKYVPVTAKYNRPNAYVVTTADSVITETPNLYWPGNDTRKMNRKMCGGRNNCVAISSPQVMYVVCVTMSSSDASASGNDEGLNTWTRRPPLSHRISSFARNPTATITNCR